MCVQFHIIMLVMQVTDGSGGAVFSCLVAALFKLGYVQEWKRFRCGREIRKRDERGRKQIAKDKC